MMTRKRMIRYQDMSFCHFTLGRAFFNCIYFKHDHHLYLGKPSKIINNIREGNFPTLGVQLAFYKDGLASIKILFD